MHYGTHGYASCSYPPDICVSLPERQSSVFPMKSTNSQSFSSGIKPTIPSHIGLIFMGQLVNNRLIDTCISLVEWAFLQHIYASDSFRAT